MYFTSACTTCHGLPAASFLVNSGRFDLVAHGNDGGKHVVQFLPSEAVIRKCRITESSRRSLSAKTFSVLTRSRPSSSLKGALARSAPSLDLQQDPQGFSGLFLGEHLHQGAEIYPSMRTFSCKWVK